MEDLNGWRPINTAPDKEEILLAFIAENEMQSEDCDAAEPRFVWVQVGKRFFDKWVSSSMGYKGMIGGQCLIELRDDATHWKPISRSEVVIEEIKSLQQEVEHNKKIIKRVKENVIHTIYDCCHSCSQPSMRDKTWGEIKDYITKYVKESMDSVTGEENGKQV